MDETAITQYLTNTFAGVETDVAMGYTFFFYGADHMLPFVTLAVADNDYDRVSNLDRPGVFRLNLGVSKPTFQSLFGAERIDVSTYDFARLDTLMPHPDYAPQSWICVLSPSTETFETLKPMLAEAYDLAVQRQAHRAARE
jgi:hypothetical protein